LQKLISHGNTEITEEIKVFRASVANIMLRHAQKEENLSGKSSKRFPWREQAEFADFPNLI